MQYTSHDIGVKFCKGSICIVTQLHNCTFTQKVATNFTMFISWWWLTFPFAIDDHEPPIISLKLCVPTFNAALY